MSDAVPVRKRGKVACAGILVADIFVPPLPRLPEAGALLATEDFLLETGGCAANTGTDLARLGADVTVCGVVGEDVFAEFLVGKLSERGLDTSAVRRDEGGTSKTVVLTVSGEDRRFLHTFGANRRFVADDLRHPALEGADVLYLGGYIVLPSLDAEATGEVFAAARERGTKVVLDVVVPADCGPDRRALAAVLPHVDVFKPNDEEAEALTGLSDPRAQAERFLEMGCRCVVITQGGGGTLVAEGGKVWTAGVYPIHFVDGSGSGDAFDAGWILGMIEGWDTPTTLRYASAVGALACTRLGCTTAITGPEAVEAVMASHDLDVRCIEGSD
ncbi:MAG: carbohydrate kinase family protein [Armatimonadetes bacterium]|nr:carbohydrate kinase family protein [Armatimonadota bacterium]